VIEVHYMYEYKWHDEIPYPKELNIY
jgi:hypothetical protein